MYYNPYGTGSKPDYVFCLKCDYVESSHANNTGVAKFVNDCLYDTKTPMQLADSNCRTAINGFPIEVYMNGEYLGVYNFNHDRYSYQSYGYDYKKNPNMLVYEINSNSNTSAGAFYRYGDNAESSANVSELEYYKRDFNLIYGNRTTDSDTYSEIKSLVEWVSIAEQDLFRETVSEHFNKEYLFRYFLMVLFIGAVDSLGKNMKIFTMDGKIWYPQFYDMDTVLGIDNSGYLTIAPDVEIEDGSYNTSNSNLWSKVWNFFNLELKEEWKKMRQDRFTLDNLMKYIYGEQISKIPTKLYNDDAQVKYLDFGSLYTYCCHGSKEHQIRRWLRERIAYVDSMLGYFTSQEDQVTIRMNKTGYVSFEVTPYIPLYFSVKWSNATGGTQTFKLKRGETKTFYYTSTTSTDQEVLIYHAQHIKRLDNLSNLNPSSCILANAKKLTNVEIHSKELYNINVTNNIFLRNINLRDCSTLGTVTATGSSLDLSRCKYLRHCDVYNTALTEVQLDTSGGSLVDIYYPKTIQSINLIKQRLLETVGLPYGTAGEEVPTSLYNISIQECPSIKKLNTSSDPEISSSFASMVYCNNLTLRNSLDLATLNFDGFYRLKNVVIENMYNLQTIGFNNLLPAGETSTLKYVGMSNCPKLSTFELNCTSNDYEITLADDAILNLGGLISLKSITSNCVLKGIKTIIVPTGLDSMFFTNTYGSGYSTIKNIWVSSQCNVNTGGTTPTVTHVNRGYEGIDFAGMSLKNIDLGALVNIPRAINFSLSPTTVNPHFNKNRDGSTYPYLQPEGTLDLTNYTESLARFFDGVDLDKLQIVCNGNLPQTDLSYCFYNSSFSSEAAITTLLSKVSSITNLDYCFYRTTITSTDILSSINMGTSSTMNYTFAECPNITSLSGVIISRNVTAVEGMFYKCPLTSINNITVNVAGSISGLFKGCSQLTSITNLRIPNVSDASGTFEGCSKLAVLSGFELPASCTNVSNLFKGCYMLTELTMNFGSNITAGENWYPPNLETLNDTNIENGYVKMTNCSTLKNVNNLYINNGDYSDMFNGCSNLATLTLTMGSNITGLARFIKGCSKITSKPFTEIPEACVTIDEMFNGTNITDITGMTFGSKITSATDWLPIGLITANDITIKNKYIKFDGCSTLVNCNNLTITNTVNELSKMFNNCTKLANFYLSDSCDLSRVTTVLRMFYLCDALTEIDFKNLNISSMRDMTDFFRGSNNTTMKNFRLTSNSCDYTRVFYYPYYFENIYIGNNDAVNAFGKNNTEYKSQVKTITGLSFGESVTDISEMFKSCPNLTHDFIMPATITSCVETFKDCTSMTHVHSNWNNTYTGEITSTDCYAGCTGITHCDEIDLGVNEYKQGLDEVPLAWGGYEFTKKDTSIIKVDIPSDNYTIELGCSLGDSTIVWGDNISTKNELTHTYSTKGTYVIKGRFLTCFGVSFPSTSVRESLIEVHQIPNDFEGKLTRNLFRNCTKLTYVNMNNWNKLKLETNHLNSAFAGCSSLQKIDAYNACFGAYDLEDTFMECTSLSEINGTETWDIKDVVSLRRTFSNCIKLEKIDGIGGWNTSIITSVQGLFSNCKMLDESILQAPLTWDLSKCTSFSYMYQGCTQLTSPPITTFGNANTPATKCSYSEIYYGCTFTAKGITFKVVGACELYRVFIRCKQLDSTITFEWSTDQPVNIPGLFCEGTNVSVLGNFNLTSCTNLFTGYFFGGIGSQANNNLTTFNCYGVQTYNLNISNYPNLSKDSILNIINCLCETTSTLTLTLGSTNMAKLTDAEIAIATAKGWTVV